MPSPADRTGVSTQRNSPRENRSRPLRVLAQRITRIEKGCSKLTATNLPRLLSLWGVHPKKVMSHAALRSVLRSQKS
jgi:hypothetical protein